MTLVDAALAIMLAQPAHWTDKDEAPKARVSRFRPVAAFMVEAAKGDRHVLAAELVLWDAESKGARYVQAGCIRVPKGAADCDGGRARSPWQMWPKACPAGWALPRGSHEALKAFAGCAARLWQAARRRCQSANDDPLVGAYSGYRSMCRWEPAKRRAARHRVMLARL